MSNRRYYRRPYINQSRHSDDDSSGFVLKVLSIIFGLVGITFLLSSLLPGLLGWAIVIGILVLIVIGVRKLLKWSDVSTATHVSQRDMTQINSEKHGCKCYMEGLSYGEKEVADTLSRELSYKDYFIFNNLIIPSENNGSTQIDHIVVSRFGIFVIESKDYKGWVFGDKDQPFWTQSLPGGRSKFQFQNPLRQNYAHIMALKTLMPFAFDDFISIVVFSSKSEIKTVPIQNVLHLDQLIRSIQSYTQEKLTQSDVQVAIGKLSYACQTVDITTAEHIANLHVHQPVLR